MDWLILILLVPTFVVPIVLLCGFAGCAEIAGISDGPGTPPPTPPPLLLTVRAIGPTGVRLEWKPDSSAKFFVERALGDGTFLSLSEAEGEGGIQFIDTVTKGLAEGTTYTYRVRRARGGGSKSNPSATFKVTTWPDPPIQLTKEVAEVGRIKISWTNVSARADQYRVRRRSPPGSGTYIPFGPFPLQSSHDDKVDPINALVAGSEHEYVVIVIVSEGFDNGEPKAVESEPSDPYQVAIP